MKRKTEPAAKKATKKTAAKRTRVRRAATFTVFRSNDGQWYAHLKAPNGEIVTVSEGYTRMQKAEKWCFNLWAWAIEASAQGLVVEDET